MRINREDSSWQRKQEVQNNQTRVVPGVFKEQGGHCGWNRQNYGKRKSERRTNAEIGPRHVRDSKDADFCLESDGEPMENLDKSSI